MLVLLNFLLSLADILLLAMLLAIVCLYTGSDTRVLQLLPAVLRDRESLLPACSLVILFISKCISGYYLFRAQSKFFFSISFRLAALRLDRYFNSRYEQYVATERAQLINAVNHQPIEFAQNILTSIQTIVTECSLIGITIIAILAFKPTLFLMLLLFLMPPVLLAGVLMKRKVNHVKQHISNDIEKANQHLNESFSSYIESAVYGRKDFFGGRYLHFQKRLSTDVSELQIIQWLPSRLVEVFAVLGFFALVLFHKLAGQTSDLADIGAFIAAAYKIMPGISRITNASALLRTYQSVISALAAPAETKPETVADPALQSIQEISLQQVHFAYRGKPVLKHLTMTIRKGDFLFVNGPSGTGKTTFLNLLLGFIPPSEGQVCYNGIPLNEQNAGNILKRTSYIRQQALIIRDTIKANIALEDAPRNEEQFRQAVAFAGLESLLSGLEQGADTLLADEGKDISGGQKQRIAMARAMYHDADLIVLDEPFNELDQESEKKILVQLQQLAASGKIIVLISHSLLATEYCSKQLTLSA
ncbi:ABC-type lipopolysaccharide transporter PglK [Rurimicrobium arvi]|uniref:ABC-type lipopolysaccharide transporter PglK n=1 Tax=Rurimicrobium arvi TaxID=2049916 RepID=A0ABP8N0V0_9BACT